MTTFAPGEPYPGTGYFPKRPWEEAFLKPRSPQAPSPAIVDLIENGLVEITRRVEFYEANGTTRWNPNAPDDELVRLIGGSVTVDYGSDERRKLDVTLENIDKSLRPNPYGGLWYDKIIKVYRGIRYSAEDAMTPLAVVESEDGQQAGIKFSQLVSRMGYVNNSLKFTTTNATDLADYDYIVSLMNDAPTLKSAMLTTLFNQGKNIITIGAANTVAELPHYTSTPAAPNTVTNLFANAGVETAGSLFELFRNLCTNPLPASGTGYATVNGSTVAYDAPTSSVRVTVAAGGTNDQGVAVGSIMGAVTAAAYTYSVEVEAISACTLRMSVQGAFGTGDTASVVFAAGEIKRMNITVTHTGAGTPSVYVLRGTGTSALAMDYRVRKVMKTLTTEAIDYFDGANKNNYFNDPDFTVAWTGTANASASIIQGISVTGLTFNGIAPAGLNSKIIRSSKWAKAGSYSVRVIPALNGSTDTAIAWTLTAAQDTKTYTVQATIHLEAPQTGTIDATRARRIVAFMGTTTLSAPAANAAGSTDLQHTFTCGLPNRALRFYNAAANFKNDVWYDNFVAVERSSYSGGFFSGTAAEYGIAPVASDNPTQGAFVAEATTPPTVGTAPAAVVAGVTRLSVWPPTPGNTMVTAAIATSPSGGFWLDLHLPNVDGTEAQKLLKSALDYMRYFERYKTWEIQLGEFMIDGISEDNFPDQIKVTGRDLTKKLITSKLSRTSTFPIGTGVEAFVRGQLALAGIPVAKMSFDMGGETFATEVSFEKGTTRWDMIKSTLESFGYEKFFDAFGIFTVRKYLDPTTAPVSQVFGTGPDGNLVSFSKSVNDSRIFNHIIVTGEGLGDDSLLGYFGEAEVLDLSLPTHRDRIGDRVEMIDAPWISSDDEANVLALQRLRISALESYELSFASIYYSWLEGGTIVQINDPDAFDFEPDRFLMDSISFPFDLGPMSATGKRVIIVEGGIDP